MRFRIFNLSFHHIGNFLWNFIQRIYPCKCQILLFLSKFYQISWFILAQIISRKNIKFAQNFQNCILLHPSKIRWRLNHLNAKIFQKLQLAKRSYNITHHCSPTWPYFYKINLLQIFVLVQSCADPNSKYLSKHLCDLRGSREIAAFVENMLFGRVIAMLWVRQGKFHETSHCHVALFRDFIW